MLRAIIEPECTSRHYVIDDTGWHVHVSNADEGHATALDRHRYLKQEAAILDSESAP